MVAPVHRSGPCRAGVERLVAGLLLVAAASELVPDIVRGHRPNLVALGFALGLGMMLLVSWLPRRARLKAPRGQLPTRDRSPGMLAEVLLPVSLGALLYLATREILVDAHVQPDASSTAAAFSTAFILLLLTRTLGQRG